MIHIRKAEKKDFTGIWTIIHEVLKKGDTYSYSPDSSEEEVFHIWMEQPTATYVAIENEKIVGTYFLKPNQPGLGSHICNAGFAVHPNCRGKGVGKRMCEHSIKEAISLGFKGMQFNFVVATNQVAVELWKKCGFHIVGTLHKAFNHTEKGFVDVFVMYKWFNQ